MTMTSMITTKIPTIPYGTLPPPYSGSFRLVSYFDRRKDDFVTVVLVSRESREKRSHNLDIYRDLA